MFQATKYYSVVNFAMLVAKINVQTNTTPLINPSI